MKIKWILAALGIVIVSALIYLLSQKQWADVEYELDLSKEINKDPFTMAKRFLTLYDKQWQQIKARSLFDNNQQLILDKQHVLLIDESILSQSHQLNQSLSQWVAAGGHLIYLLSQQRQQLGIDDSDFFSSLDIEVELFEDAKPAQTKLDTIEDSNITLTVNNQQPLQIFLEEQLVISYCPGDDYNTDFGDTLICDLSYDQGRVTVITSLSTFTNVGLKHYDHGSYLLWLLDDKDNIAYLPYFITDQWWHKLWQYSWQLVLAAGLLIILFIWQQSSRIGVAINADQHANAPFKLHLSAISRFMWQHGHQQQLQQALLKDFYAIVELRIPNFQQLSEQQKIQRISQLSQWPEDSIKNLLQQSLPDNQSQRSAYIQKFQQLRKAL